MSPTDEQTKAVVFVALNSYPLFDRAVNHPVGGMETRSVLLAEALARRGRWKTIFAVGDFGQASPSRAGDVDLVIYSPFWKRVRDNVVPRFRKHKWRPVVHLDIQDIHFIWQLPAYLLIGLLPKCLVNRFWRSMRPDVVCCFGNNPTSAEVIADCYRDGIKTVLCIASDDDLSADYRPKDRRLNDYGTPRWMAWYAINTADYIMVQTERQRLLLERNFNRTGTLIHNPVPIPGDARQSWPLRAAREFVLWIGRSDTFHKRPQLVLGLARACPHIQFMMIVNRTNRGVFESLQRDRPANVTIVERVPHHEMAAYYRRARVMISTSAYEGFPNTFLQAAVAGVPVVSLNVDPEDILAGKGCGICAGGDFDRFVQAVGALWSDNVRSDCYAETFLNYVVDNHSLERQILRFEELLGRAVMGGAATRAPGCWRWPFSRFVHRRRLGG
jgi:glycosyltransferase involved in cell wall biosynthesis